MTSIEARPAPARSRIAGLLSTPLADGLLALLLGALQTLAFVHTAAWWLPILTLAWLCARWQAVSPRRAALVGWLYGTAWLAAGTGWLFISMHRYGGLPAPLAAAAVLALSAALSVYLAAAGFAFARLRRGTAWDALLFVALWLLAELARGLLFTGFPWVAAGYAQVDSPLAALAPWVGVYGMGALVAALGFGLAQLTIPAPGAPRRWHALLGAAALLGGVGWLPAEFTQPTVRTGVALLQTNVPQDEKFAAEKLPENLAWVHAELLRATAPLVVAPETAVPLLPDQLKDFAPGYWQALEAHFTRPGRAALVGVPLGDFERGYTNSVLGLSAAMSAAPPHRYDKYHLVPFGEFIPPGFRWFTEMMAIPLGDFARGSSHPPPFEALGQRFGPNICYEDLFGEELARRFVDAARAPTVMVNLSNIGWFGQSIAIPQHLHISRVRTLELQRPMLRSTNTGATAVIDHRGVVTAQLPPHVQGVLTHEVEGRSGVTPYAAWVGRWGLWPLVGLGLAVVVLSWVRTRIRAPILATSNRGAGVPDAPTQPLH